MYNKKYKVIKIEEFNGHNPLYDNMLDATCYLVYFNVGERGWFLREGEAWFIPPHRVHTSIVKDVQYLNNLVIVTTQNTRFTFALINENSGDE